MLYRVLMTNIPRQVRFPLPVCEFGTVFSLPQRNNQLCYKDKLEVTLRLNSGVEYAQDLIDGTDYRTTFPNMMTKLPGMTHHYSVEDSRDAFFFSYASELVPEIRRMGLLSGPPVRPIRLTAPVNLLVRQIVDFIPHTQEYGVADRIDLLCFQLLEELRLQGGDGEPDAASGKILQLASFLRVHFTEDIDLDELAGQFGLSRRTMFRQWARQFEVSPIQYIANLKLEEAKRLLRETSLDIAALSLNLNFNEPAYFCAFFKKNTGQSPSQYRRDNTIETRNMIMGHDEQ